MDSPFLPSAKPAFMVLWSPHCLSKDRRVLSWETLQPEEKDQLTTTFGASPLMTHGLLSDPIMRALLDLSDLHRTLGILIFNIERAAKDQQTF